MPSEPKPKKRCSYDAALRKDAKAKGLGLMTVAITFPNGETEEYQIAGNASDCRFARWAGVLLAEAEARPLPDLEQFVRTHIENES
tara:strand:- start:7060 stop:7317 length:258 start_codon:yes stop_codon:yes gene_type:complete